MNKTNDIPIVRNYFKHEVKIVNLFIIYCLFACQSNVSEDNSKIGQLKQQLKDSPTKENRDALVMAYQEAITANPSDEGTNTIYLKEITDLQMTNKAFVPAIQTLMQSIRTYPTAKTTADNVWLLGEIYQQHVQRPTVATIVKKLYADQFPNARFGTVAKKVLAENPATIAENIATLGSSMYDEQTHKVDYQAANDYIRMCELYALVKPQEDQSPEYLHKAGETARSIRAFSKAVELYDRIYAQYPTYEKAAQALFLKAFTYDNDLNDKATAKALYEEFLQKYPNDDFADDTEFLLNNLGKDDEEIIKGFSQKS